MKLTLKHLIFIFLLSSIFFSCKKEKLLTDSSAKISFSNDSVRFDTVFTTIGSVTKRLKVYNPNKGTIKISDIRIAGGSNSNFRINVDGTPGEAKDVEIKAHDSIFIFVEVTVDPNNSNSPFVIDDSLLFSVNGNTQKVILQAWGQNAIYITPKYYVQGLPPYSIIPNGTVWDNTKPILIYGYAVVDSAFSLTISAGTHIYFHKNGGLWVYPYGKITVNGTKSDPVIFQGDRLEYEYHDVPGQWDRIWINEGTSDDVFNYAVIKNGFIGLQVEPLPFGQNTNSVNTNKVVLNNTIIENCTGFGLYARNSQVETYNTLIGNCGSGDIGILGAGNYNFYQSTFANYWSETERPNANISLQNYYTDAVSNSTVVGNQTTNFYNCINTGDEENEFDFDQKTGGIIQYLFDHCLVKTNKSTPASNYNTCVINPSGNLFNNTENNDYHLVSGSAAIDKADINTVNAHLSELQYDLDHFDRTTGTPDIGAYEFH